MNGVPNETQTHSWRFASTSLQTISPSEVPQIGESVISTQRAFPIHLTSRRNDAVPDRKSILLLIENSIRNSIKIWLVFPLHLVDEV